MKKYFIFGLVTVILFSTVFGCGGSLPAARPANSNPSLTAFPAPCLTSATEQGLQPPPKIPIAGPASATPGCQVFLPAIKAAEPISAYCQAIQNGLTYLAARYNPALGLLNEAPQVAPHTYWLTNDNALAAYAFAQLGQADLSATINKSILRYGSATNGLIEVVWGMPVSFPPYDKFDDPLDQVGEDAIMQEVHDRGLKLTDWAEYADLGFYGALNNFHQGDRSGALSVYASTLELYDGTGFHDAAFEDSYATYKLALAFYVGAIIQAPNPYREQMLATLLSMQDDNGGFHTEYDKLQKSGGDTNTETSALALLALSVGGCNP